MKTQSNYEAAGWDFDDVWYMDYTAGVEAVDAYWETLDVNYTHLEGRDVCVFADSNSEGTYLVTDGELVGIDPGDYTTFLGGLNYYSIYETYPIVLTSQWDSTAARDARIYHVLMAVEETMDAEVGVISSDLSDLYFDGMETTIIDFPFLHGWTREPTFYLSIWEPVPFTLNHLTLNMEIDND